VSPLRRALVVRGRRLDVILETAPFRAKQQPGRPEKRADRLPYFLAGVLVAAVVAALVPRNAVREFYALAGQRVMWRARVGVAV
jgi:hypothetical protein